MADEARIDRSVKRRRRLARAGFGLVIFLMLVGVAVGIVECAMMPHDSGGDGVEGPSVGTPPDGNDTTVTVPRPTTTVTGAASTTGSPGTAYPAPNADYHALYTNTEYGFTFYLPESWRGLTIVSRQWEGQMLDTEQGTTVTGPEILIRHPLWTESDPRQDIPIMVFTLGQWDLVQAEKLGVGAAPIPPTELGRNSKYVFALPARYNFAFLTGFEEVEQILADHAWQPLPPWEDLN